MEAQNHEQYPPLPQDSLTPLNQTLFTQHLTEFLNRVQLTGAEVQAFHDLRNVVVAIGTGQIALVARDGFESLKMQLAELSAQKEAPRRKPGPAKGTKRQTKAKTDVPTPPAKKTAVAEPNVQAG